jgi:glycosyltransferase involved in cell wall biosynthesis
LSEFVIHRGYVPDVDREALYAGARLIVLPSLDEGFGLPALEAMAAGVPLIVSPRGSLPEVVGKGAVVLDSLTADALAEAIRLMVTDRVRAMGWAAAGLARAAAYTWSDTVATLHQAYAEAIARRQARGAGAAHRAA